MWTDVRINALNACFIWIFGDPFLDLHHHHQHVEEQLLFAGWHLNEGGAIRKRSENVPEMKSIRSNLIVLWIYMLRWTRVLCWMVFRSLWLWYARTLTDPDGHRYVSEIGSALGRVSCLLLCLRVRFNIITVIVPPPCVVVVVVAADDDDDRRL